MNDFNTWSHANLVAFAEQSHKEILELRSDLNYFKSLNKKLLKYGVELVFVNDGSTDGTLDILKQVSFKPRILNLKKNVGKAEAIRQGVVSTFEALNQDDFSFSLEDFRDGPKILSGKVDVSRRGPIASALVRKQKAQKARTKNACVDRTKPGPETG
jgi:hypothetical protein